MRKLPVYESALEHGYVRRISGFTVRRLAASGLCAALLAFSHAATAQESPGLGEAIGRLFEGADLKSPTPAPADFVVNSRPRSPNSEYAPYAAPDAATEAKKKTAKDFEAIGAELSKAGALNRARAAGIAKPDAPASAAGKPKKSASGAERSVKGVD
jgi:hypothetical protein